MSYDKFCTRKFCYNKGKDKFSDKEPDEVNRSLREHLTRMKLNLSTIRE